MDGPRYIWTKPLSYFSDQSKFLFASDARILSNYLNKKEIELESINGFLCYGYIPSNSGFYKNIFDLFPGHIYKYDVNTKNLYNFLLIKRPITQVISNAILIKILKRN